MVVGAIPLGTSKLQSLWATKFTETLDSMLQEGHYCHHLKPFTHKKEKKKGPLMNQISKMVKPH